MAPVSKLLWGSSLENELRFGYPIFDFLSDREERDGSRHETSAAGVDSSWIVGRDFILDAEVRWIPDGPGTNPVQTALSGPVSWQEFLDWARDAHTFRFVPDETVPNFYIDNVALVEPRKGFGNLSPDIKRNVRLKLRNPTVDFHQALRGIMFEYAPGMSLTDPILATFARATAATYRGIPGTLASPIGASAASGIIRDRHYEGVLRTALLEAARTQLVTDPENFGAWTLSGTPIRTAGQADPFGGTAAYVLQDDDAGVLERILQAVTFTGNAEKCASIFMRQGTSLGGHLGIHDATAAIWRRQVRVTWTAGVPVLSDVLGAGTSFPSEPWGNGWWRVAFSATGVIAANTNNFYVGPTFEIFGEQGTLFYFGANAWNAPFPSSYQGPSVGTRNADAFSWPYPYPPQSLFVYVELVERGTAVEGSADGSRVMAVGATPTAFWMQAASGKYKMSYLANGAQADSPTGPLSAPAIGNGIALLGLVDFATLKTRLLQSINGGATQDSGLSGAGGALPPAWQAAVLRLNDQNGANIGWNAFARVKVGPLLFGGQAIDTIAKALAR